MRPKVNGLTPFVVGELHAGSTGLNCEHPPECDKKSFSIYLTDEEVSRLNSRFPFSVFDGLATGGEVTTFIFLQRMGKVLCDEHAGEIKETA